MNERTSLVDSYFEFAQCLLESRAFRPSVAEKHFDIIQTILVIDQLFLQVTEVFDAQFRSEIPRGFIQRFQMMFLFQGLIE